MRSCISRRCFNTLCFSGGLCCSLAAAVGFLLTWYSHSARSRLYCSLADILRKAKTEQHKNRFRYGELYHLNYCKTVKEKGRTYYEVYNLQRTQETPENDRELSFVCLKEDGAFVSASAVGQICRKAKAEVEGLEDFHFHTLRHTYTSDLLSGGAKPKDVQELLGHSDVSTTMNIYAHSTREAKRTSAKLLDRVVGEA